MEFSPPMIPAIPISFSPSQIIKTFSSIVLSSKRIGLRTDASGKFEKGLDPENAMAAMDRACQLIEELGAGEVVGGAVDVYPNPVKQIRLPIEVDKMNALLGTNVSKEEVLEYFCRHLKHGS